MKASVTLVLVSLLGTLSACGGPTAVRGSDVAGLDDAAMSTGLDRRDLQLMLKTNLDSLQASGAVRRWEGENRPTVSVLPIRNETSEHIGGGLDPADLNFLPIEFLHRHPARRSTLPGRGRERQRC